MRKIMIKRSVIFISVIAVFSLLSCIKQTYNMSMLSKQVVLSPTIAISAAKGDISFSDIVKTNDTVTFDQNNLVILVFKRDSVIDLQLSDFSKGTLIQKTAVIEPGTFNLNIKDALSHISGSFLILNPSFNFNYSNSFTDSVKINLNVTGAGKTSNINLDLKPFALAIPNIPVQQEITSSFVIDKSNSNLPQLISLPPEEIDYSGTATLISYAKNSLPVNNALAPNHLIGSLEIEIPLDLQINNLQFTDTVDNFIKNNDNGKDNPVNPEDFNLLRINISAKNGFPLGASLKMSLFSSATNTILNTVDAGSILGPAPVDANGKANGVTESSATIEFTKEFFSTGNGSQEVKIYSDYRLNFNASLVVNPVINLN
jgi:hypothetical protein